MGLSYPTVFATKDKENSMNSKQRDATKPPPRDNVIGRRCAVFFELGPCFFRGKENVKSGGGYFLGKVIDRSGKNKLTVRFDDSQEADYVEKEVRFIEPSNKHPNQLVLCESPDKTVATLEPANVVPGDIVQANYDGSNWFRGRVAYVNTSKGTCDVAYDDGEYQTSVDIRKHIILMSKGVDDPTWLAGLPVCLKNSSGQEKKGKISDTVEKQARVMVIYEDKKTKAFSYFSIASALFLHVREQPGRTLLSWPAPRTVVAPSVPTSNNMARVLATKSVGKHKNESNDASKTQAKAKLAAKPSPKKVKAASSSKASPSRNAQRGDRSSRGSRKNVAYTEGGSDVDADEDDLIEYNPPVRSPGAGMKSKSLISVAESSSDSDSTTDALAPPKAKSLKTSGTSGKGKPTQKTTARDPSHNSQRGSRSSRGSLKNVRYAEGDSDFEVDKDDLIAYNRPMKSPGAGRKTKSLINLPDSDSDDVIVVAAPKSKSLKTSDTVEKTKAARKITASDQSHNSQRGSRSSRGSLKSVSYTECDSDVGTDEDDLIEYNPPIKSPGAGIKTKALINLPESDCDDELDVVVVPKSKSVKTSDATTKTKSTWRTTAAKIDSGNEDVIDVDAPVLKSATSSEVNKKRKAPPQLSSSIAEYESDSSVAIKKRKVLSASRTVVIADKETSRVRSSKETPRKRNTAIKLFACQEPKYFEILTDVVEMGDSESEVYISSLDSSESFVGKCFLTLTCMFHKRVPSAYHCKRLVDLLTFGPGLSRSVFPDHNRMEDAMKVFRLLVIQHGLADHIASGLDSDYVERAMHQASAPYYTIAGDERRCTSAALQRLGLTLHARACCMEVFEVLLKHQLRGCLGVTHPDDQYRSRPLANQIITFPHQRTKGALKQLTKEYVLVWCQYSHFINGSFRCPPEECNPNLLEESFDFVRSQASRVATSLGRALSYMCCLYGADSSAGLKSVGCDIINFFKDELDHNKFETNIMVSDQVQNIRLQGKIGMIVHLDETIIPDVLSTLAETLDVVDSFNTIYSLLAK